MTVISSPLSYLGVPSANPPNQIVQTRNPAAGDAGFPLGTLWINTANNTAWQLTGVIGQTATWTALGTGAVGGVTTLTGDAGGAIAPALGNINVLGTANQIATTGAGNTITWSIPAAFIAPGSIASTTTMASGTTLAAGTSMSAGTSITAGTNITATAGNISATAGSVTAGTTLTATLGNITATNGNLVLNTAGNKIVSTSVGTTTAAGANSFGSVTLVGGTATVATTAVTANSLIILWRQSVGATGAAALGLLSVGTITAATSFVINAWQPANATALQASDVSVIGWMIIN